MKASIENFPRFLSYVISNGRKVQVGSKLTFEIVNANLEFKNPRHRIVYCERKMNFPFAVAEWLCLMTGESRVELFTPFIADYGKRFSSDGKLIDGAYGFRTAFKSGKNQILEAIDVLKADMSSRQAVVSIYDGKLDLFQKATKSVPCTIAIQFLIRNEKLDMIVTMRSNDVYTGLVYDFFQFTMLQEFVSAHVGVELGTYYHNAGSFHVYEDDLPKIEKLIYKHWPLAMHRMPALSQEQLNHLRLAYLNVDNDRLFLRHVDRLPGYCRNLAFAAKAFVNRKSDPKESYKMISDVAIRKVLREWL